MQTARELHHATSTTTAERADSVADSAPISRVAPQRLCARDGSSAELDESDVLRIRDRRGAILFEYDPDSGRGRLTLAEGDLSLEAPRGNIELLAGGEVRCLARGDIALHSASSVSMTASDAAGGRAGVQVDRRAVAITGERLALTADEAELRLERTRFLGDWVETGIARAELLVDKLESRVGTLVQRASNVFQFVEELHQLKTKRFRVRTEEGMQLDAGHVVMKAREDVDIDGAQINLG